jgi:AcrR family transcriptional regulator
MCMSPRPAPDLPARRTQVLAAARRIAEQEGWPTVTTRRLAAELGVTAPTVYTAFATMTAVRDGVAESGFAELAAVLSAPAASHDAVTVLVERYLDWAQEHPALYDAMFVLPSDLPFAVPTTPPAMLRAFAAIGSALPGATPEATEVAWGLLHGLATLERGGRFGPAGARTEPEGGRRQAAVVALTALPARPAGARRTRA